ncbi:endonuclease/exonuclease/phosphatase family protein [Azohydromonas aeria]|uniref:endonuclease/exonuclease/phosphatase family protein n=1 Tax=Azohydromonas aeria TaxID=2590212 RepID=UPI001E59F97E|nr:endonuclease/exonuclease/phosphatase family protein [Azohydromonas aeria]
MATLTLTTFNFHNLFRRAKILNLRDSSLAAELLDRVEKLNAIIAKAKYMDKDRQDVFALSSALVDFIDFRVDGGSFGAWDKQGEVTGWGIYSGCEGRKSWQGEMIFKNEPFTDEERANTAKVILDANADVVCAVEIEGMDALNMFNRDALKKRFAQFVSIDSPNDPRHIDVACLSRFPVIGIKTHVFDAYRKYRRVFSRDCLEVAIDIGGNAGPLFVLCNHFKSQLGRGPNGRQESADKRRAQAERVREILGAYDLKKQLVAVMGDLNEDSSNPYQSLAPLFNCPDLMPVVDPKLPAVERFTYYYAKAKKSERLSQLDYIFVSSALHDRHVEHGFVRGGIYGIVDAVKDAGGIPPEPFPNITTWSQAASDHAALWARFDL